jgi:hypothetical protein
MTSVTAVRSVRVERLSARAELFAVARVAMAIVAGVWMFLATQFTGANTPAGRRNLLPFQKLMADRPSAEQRMFRELQEALLEGERIRSTSGSWPDVQALAADGIPPFAADPTRRDPYHWERFQSGTIVNYLGLPDTPNAPAWLLFVQEPEPGVPPDQAFEDEEHHRLTTGAMLHVSTWVHEHAGAITKGIVRLPQAEGWLQLYAVGPSAVPTASPPR